MQHFPPDRDTERRAQRRPREAESAFETTQHREACPERDEGTTRSTARATGSRTWPPAASSSGDSRGMVNLVNFPFGTSYRPPSLCRASRAGTRAPAGALR